MKKLFVLMGASGAGKSTLLNRVIQDGYCNAVVKYSERKRFNSVDDISTVEDIRDPKLQCDLIYKMYNNIYGFSSHKIFEQLQRENAILITNDIKTIERLKNFFPKQVVVVYVFSDINQRLLGQIYMKRHGAPSMKNKKTILIEELKKCEDLIINDKTEEFVQRIEKMNITIDNILLEDNEFKLRLESIKRQEELYLFAEDYIVFNLYSNKESAIHATESAYEQLKRIISKEMEEEK